MSLQDNPDVFYSQGRAAVWSSVEINIGIFCNSVIVLKSFMRQYFPSFFASYGSSAGQVTPGSHRRPGNNSSFAKFGASNDRQRSYVMQSMERGDHTKVEVGEDELELRTKSGIVVTNSYKVDSDRGTETESTEDILEPSRKIRGGHYSPA
jgi:hypothetical protein